MLLVSARAGYHFGALFGVVMFSRRGNVTSQDQPCTAPISPTQIEADDRSHTTATSLVFLQDDIFYVDRIKLMDEYHISKRSHFDLALIKLNRTIPLFNSIRQPICLPTNPRQINQDDTILS